MTVIEPKVSIDPPVIDLKSVTAGSKTMNSVVLNVSFPTEITLSPSVAPSDEGSVTANLYLEEKHTVINLEAHDWKWSDPTFTNEGSSALVQPAKNDYSFPLGPDMSQSQTQIRVEVIAPSTLGPFTKSVKVGYHDRFERLEIVGEATGL